MGNKSGKLGASGTSNSSPNTQANGTNFDQEQNQMMKQYKKQQIERNMIFKQPNEPAVSLEDFEMLKVVGQGNFAKVMQVRKKDTGKIYAMKILNKSQLAESDQLEHIKTERAVLQFIEHPFLVKLYYAFQTKGKLYMVLKFVNGGELFYHLKREKRFGEARAKYYSAEIFLVLEQIHKHNVIYRDLKPENVLLDRDGHVLLTDFGLSKILSGATQKTHTFCGTPEYLAPEVLLQKGHDRAVDWWSFGTLLYEMLIGIPPFYSDNIQEMYKLILEGKLEIPPGLISKEAEDLLTKLLERNPAKRIEVKAIRKHPFFRDIDFDKILNKEVPPLYKPNVKDDYDLSNFEEEFTKMPVEDKEDNYNAQGGGNGGSGNGNGSGTVLGESMQEEFEGFTYSQSNMMSASSGDGYLGSSGN